MVSVVGWSVGAVGGPVGLTGAAGVVLISRVTSVGCHLQGLKLNLEKGC